MAQEKPSSYLQPPCDLRNYLSTPPATYFTLEEPVDNQLGEECIHSSCDTPSYQDLVLKVDQYKSNIVKLKDGFYYEPITDAVEEITANSNISSTSLKPQVPPIIIQIVPDSK